MDPRLFHAAVTAFYRLSVKDYVELVAGWKMGVIELKKFLTNIGLYCFAEWGLNQIILLRPVRLLGENGLYWSTWSCPLRQRATSI